MHKRCSRCLQELPVEAFCKTVGNRDGLAGRCRKCTTAIARAYRASPEVKKREYDRRAERIASGKRYPSEMLSPRKPPSPEERAASAERAAFRGRIAGARTNAERFGVAVNDLTVDDWYEVLAEHGRRCFYCGVEPTVLWIDHFVPIARGGGNTKSNVVPSCEPCNRRKSKRSAEQFLNNLCHRDHPLWGDNLYVYPDGVKFACKTCRQASVDRSEAKRGRRNRTDHETAAPVRGA